MCGVVGIVGKSSVNQDLYDSLLVLQHRGQDAAGIVVSDGSRMSLRKANGLVAQVFEPRHMLKLPGTIMGIGHVRYPTAGSMSSAEAQPMVVNSPFGISLAHNGNLTNARELRADVVKKELRHLNTASDSEVLLNVFAHELHKSAKTPLKPDHVFEAVSSVQRRCRGAFAAVAMIVGGGIVGFRDARGIRPLVIGRRTGALFTEYMIASESAALEILGFELLRDVLPGEAVYITQDGEFHSHQCAESVRHTPCVFEFVYLARPDSRVDSISVYQARFRMGQHLVPKILNRFSQHSHDIDVVIPIPDTSRTAAVPVARELGVPYSDAFVKNRYIGRTFIMPGQLMRQKSVRQKLNAIGEEFKGKNVLLVEDSIVRGTTTREIIQQARTAGANKVYIAVAAPPVRYPNVYGIDMPTAQEFVTNGRTVEEVAEFIGADMLVYQDLDGLVAATRGDDESIEEFECSIFDGEYGCEDVNAEYLTQLSRERNDQTKLRRDAEIQAQDGLLDLSI